MHFDLTDLQLFLQVAEQGSLSKAAARTAIALSAASSRMRQLESRLGQALFVRHASGMRLTAAGVLLREHAQEILRAAQDGQAALDALAQAPGQTLTLWANTTACATLLPHRLGVWLAANPALGLNLREGTSRDVLRAVERGEADIGVIDGDFRPEHLLLLPLGHYRMVALLPLDHPLADLDQCSFEALLRQPMLALSEGSSLRRFIERMAMLAGLRLHVRASASNYSALARWAEAGAGVAIVPEMLGRELSQSHALKLQTIAEPWAERSLQLCLREETGWRPSLRSLVQALKQG
ncbi:MAG: LysR family transcriptional regulator [Rhodoferax sp.]